MAAEGIETEDKVEGDERDGREQQVGQLRREGRKSNLRWGEEHRSEVEPAKGVMDRHIHRSLIQDEEKEESYQEIRAARGYKQDESKGA
jgi:hypothetical protein